MKQIFLSILAILAIFTSCDPVEESISAGGSITAEELKNSCKVTVATENGKNVNSVHVTTDAPCTIVWSNGTVNKSMPTADFTMLVTGEQTITCTAMNGDGSIVTAEFPVNIEELSANYPVSKYWGHLCGTGEKTWTWDSSINGHCWGNGGYSGVNGLLTGGDWWGIDESGLAEQVTSYNYNLQDVAGATMTFSLKGSALTKSSGGVGTFAFDETNTVNLGGYGDIGATMGRFTTTGGGILFPILINSNDPSKPFYNTRVSSFDISYIDDDHLILCHPNYPASNPENASWMEGTFWRFKPAK